MDRLSACWLTAGSIFGGYRISAVTGRFVCCWILLLGLSGNIARAAVVERDWKTPGDGLLTYDDVNRREWLDLSVSRLDQFPQPRLVNAIAEVTPGGLFEGFTWAKRDDVRAFAESAGIDTSTSDIGVNQFAVTSLIGLLGPTSEGTSGLRSIGLINELQIQYPSLPNDGAAFLINYGGFAGVFFNLPDDLLRPISNGLMLYRVVPEPSVAMQLAVVLAFLVWHGRTRLIHS
jgi:hypothetical protein